jgi:hypothetical protein
MAGSLVQVNKTVASGTPATIQVTGINADEVYLVTARGLIPSSDDTIAWRVTKSGTIQTDSEYDNGRKDMPATAVYQNNNAVNATSVSNADIESTGNGFNGLFYLYNFNSSSEYSYGSFNNVSWVSTPQAFGGNGGFVHTVASASDGLSFFFTGGATFNNGAEIVLYRVV